MKRAMVFLAVLLLSGCIGRTYLTERNKLDFDPITGERHAPTNDPKDNEKLMVWEIELNKKSSQPKPIATTESVSEPTTSTESPQTSAITTPEPVNESSTTPAVAPASGDKTYTEYTIQKNDTLQKIAQKFYGTTKKWQMLYNENKDVLKGPDKVYPGLVIKIPNKQ